MKAKLLIPIILLQIMACEQANQEAALLTRSSAAITSFQQSFLPQKIEDIPVPTGFQRINVAENSFGNWLRKIRLRNDRRVFLFDGTLKRNQEAQHAVLDIPVGKKDLQQCADAVMRLRASFLFDQGRLDEISFADNNGKKYNYNDFRTYNFEKYLERVFASCGTLSLERQLKKINEFNKMQIGDVLIRGGSPGHAVIVIDMATNANGRKIFMIAQSYMPAQDIHILKNLHDSQLSPWYDLEPKALINTPEWDFIPAQLRRW